MRSGAAALAVADVRVRFGSTVALDGISFEVDSGSTVALIGPNGSGKTTLLDVVAGLRGPDRGSVSRGTPGPVAYVTQRHGDRWLPLTTAEIVRMGRYGERGLVGRLGAHDREIIDQVARSLEIGHLADRQYHELSAGQRQRVLVAQAVVQQPTLLLLDEANTGLDIASRDRITEVVAGVAASGTTVLLSTHHLDEARPCDVVLLLSNRLIARGPPATVLTESNLREAYVGRILQTTAARDTDGVIVVDDHGHGTGSL